MVRCHSRSPAQLGLDPNSLLSAPSNLHTSPTCHLISSFLTTTFPCFRIHHGALYLHFQALSPAACPCRFLSPRYNESRNQQHAVSLLQFRSSNTLQSSQYMGVSGYSLCDFGSGCCAFVYDLCLLLYGWIEG